MDRPRAKYLGEGRSRQPEPISEVLASVFERTTRIDRRAVELIDRWNDITGSTWAGSRPVSIRNGLLTVEASGGAEASLLRYEVDGLVAVIAKRFGPDLVRSVRVRVARSRGK